MEQLISNSRYLRIDNFLRKLRNVQQLCRETNWFKKKSSIRREH